MEHDVGKDPSKPYVCHILHVCHISPCNSVYCFGKMVDGTWKFRSIYIYEIGHPGVII